VLNFYYFKILKIYIITIILDRLNQTMDNQSSNKNEITIELKPINNDNSKKTVEFIDNVEDLDDLRQELTSSKIKNTELYDEKPLGKILSSILNFNSLIPANKDINDENNDKKKVKVIKLITFFNEIYSFKYSYFVVFV
jgi:hypothetical protein